MYAVVLNPPRKRRRRKGRSKSRVTKRRRRRSSNRRRRTGRRRRARNKSTWVPAFKNPRRRRRRRRKARNKSTWVPAFKNPRRRRRRNRRGARYNYGRRHRRRRNPYWAPNYAMNPRGGVLGPIIRAYKPKMLMGMLPAVGGIIGNKMISGFISQYMPSMLQSGAGNVLLGLGTAGITGAAAGMVNRKWASPVFLGGVFEAAFRGVEEFVLPAIGMSGCCGGLGYPSYAQRMITGDYMPDFQEASGINNVHLPSYAQATGINPYNYGMQGMGDYLTRANAAEARPLGDYLTRENAAEARPLGGFSTQDMVASNELGTFG